MTTKEPRRIMKLGHVFHKRRQLVIAFSLPRGELYELMKKKKLIEDGEEFLRNAAIQVVATYCDLYEEAKDKLDESPTPSINKKR